jgi:hypothetical protein
VKRSAVMFALPNNDAMRFARSEVIEILFETVFCLRDALFSHSLRWYGVIALLHVAFFLPCGITVP